jgi:hypothetical protein
MSIRLLLPALLIPFAALGCFHGRNSLKPEQCRSPVECVEEPTIRVKAPPQKVVVELPESCSPGTAEPKRSEPSAPENAPKPRTDRGTPESSQTGKPESVAGALALANTGLTLANQIAGFSRTTATTNPIGSVGFTYRSRSLIFSASRNRRRSQFRFPKRISSTPDNSSRWAMFGAEVPAASAGRNYRCLWSRSWPQGVGPHRGKKRAPRAKTRKRRNSRRSWRSPRRNSTRCRKCWNRLTTSCRACLPVGLSRSHRWNRNEGVLRQLRKLGRDRIDPLLDLFETIFDLVHAGL